MESLILKENVMLKIPITSQKKLYLQGQKNIGKNIFWDSQDDEF